MILKAGDALGGYRPTDAEKKNNTFSSGHFLLSGDGIFHTIQGEGPFIGNPATFVRLNKCDLACDYCDTWYTRKKDEKEYYQSTKVAVELLESLLLQAQVDKGLMTPVKNVVFTGGEPLLQQKNIAAFMKQHSDWQVQIETNGANFVREDVLLQNAYFNCSPKLANAKNKGNRYYNPGVIQQIAETNRAIFKFVFNEKKDIDTALEMYGHLIPKEQVYFMPEGVTKEENAQVFASTIDYLISLGVKISLRGQNIMRDGSLRGV